MNALSWLDFNSFVDGDFCVRFALTLLHFLWQGSAIAGMVAIAGLLLRTASARLRYGVNCAAILLMVACVPYTFVWLGRVQTQIAWASEVRTLDESHTNRDVEQGVTGEGETSATSDESDQRGTSTGSGSANESLSELSSDRFSGIHTNGLQWPYASLVGLSAPIATVAYMMGVFLMLARLAIALSAGHRLQASAQRMPESRLTEALSRVAARVGLRSAPALAYCQRIAVPVVVGILKPTILIPSSLASGLSTDQLETILTHELAHIRRFDLLVNLLQRLIESLLFFHPGVWYVSRRLSIEREDCCDDAVLRYGFEPLGYAAALLRMAELGGKPTDAEVPAPVTSLAACGDSPSQFKRRVLRLLGEADRPRLRLSRSDWTLALAVIGLAALVPVLTFAQPHPSAKQESKAVAKASTDEKEEEPPAVQRVLLIENWLGRGDHDPIVDALRRRGFDVESRSSDQPLPENEELLKFNTVVLANVPRSSGEYADSMSWITDKQIERLVENTRVHGRGLVMLGGRNSFGPGGWSGTELEKAMPVDFKWHDSKNRGALVMLMHPAELKDGNKYQRLAARAAFNQLGPSDYCGILHYTGDGGMKWLWGGEQGLVQIGDQRDELLAKIDSSMTGDVPDFQPAFRMALDELKRVGIPAGHFVILTDGDPAPPESSILKEFRQAGIAVSVVHVNLHGPVTNKLPQTIASSTGGRYYQVRRSKAAVFERIFVRECRTVAQPLIHAPDTVTRMKLVSGSALSTLLPEPLPLIKDCVITKLKNDSNAHTSLVAIGPNGTDVPVLAEWQFGTGRTAVLTTDLAKDWDTLWKSWEDRERFIGDIVRWTAMTSPAKLEDGETRRKEVEDAASNKTVVTVQLRPGGALRLSAIDVATSEPLSNARLNLERSDAVLPPGKQIRPRRVGDVLSYDDIPAGDYKLTGSVRAYSPDQKEYGLYNKPITVTIVAGETKELQVPMIGRPLSKSEIDQRWPWSAVGRVTDGDGNPVSGVNVRAATGIGTLRGGATTTTDADGRYELRFGRGILIMSRRGPPLNWQAAHLMAWQEGYVEKNNNEHGRLQAADRLPVPEDNATSADVEKLFLPGKTREVNFVLVPEPAK